MPETPKPITFTIRGRLPGKQSVRVARGHSYMPQKTRAGMDAVRAAFALAAPPGWEPWNGTVALAVVVQYEPPHSWPQWKRMLSVQRRLAVGRPDCDNVLKLIGDALNGVAYGDDRQIARATVERVYGPEDVVVLALAFGAGLPRTKAHLESEGADE